MDVIEKALAEGRKTLSEYESKQVLAAYGIPVTRELLVKSAPELQQALPGFDYPLVLKGCSPDISHKTERGLIRVDIRSEAEALDAFEQVRAGMGGGERAVLLQEMIQGKRELVVGLTRDPQFGPCVMFGLGGIFTEVLKDTAFRVAPLEKADALEMMNEIRARRILESVRGMEAADRDSLADILVNVGRIGLENPRVGEIDINPVILQGKRPVAVDALVVLE